MGATEHFLLTVVVICGFASAAILGGCLILAFATEPITTSIIVGAFGVVALIAWTIIGRLHP